MDTTAALAIGSLIISTIAPTGFLLSLRSSLRKTSSETLAAVSTSHERTVEAERKIFDLMVSRITWLEGEVGRLSQIVARQAEELRGWERKYATLLIKHDKLLTNQPQ